MQDKKFAGFGIGLRPEHYQEILDQRPAIDWFEIISEDFLIDGGAPLHYLDQIAAHYPLAMHGVSLSIGSTDSLNWDYLKAIKKLTQRINPMWVSDHLCWTGVDKVNLHDLMPLPHTEEAIQHIAARVREVQDFLGQQILLENVSSYVQYQASVMPEWEFLMQVVEAADCLILLDINNIYVNAFNHGFNPDDYLKAIDPKRVKQFHIAGHKNCHSHIVDTHDDDIIDAVWKLYAKALKLYGPVATLIERDADIPPVAQMMQELEKARGIYNDIYQVVAA